MAAMVPAGSSLPDDIDALKRLVLAREAELAAAQVEIDRAKVRETSAEAMILHLRLAVEKSKHPAWAAGLLIGIGGTRQAALATG
jgi:hypothetical protein